MRREKVPDSPSIVIYVNAHFGQEAKLREVAAGIEEEGIPSSWFVAAGDAVALAHRGASESRLGVGIGISTDSLSVHYHKLPGDKPLFALPAANNPVAWRQLGNNAARLVKGTPFKYFVAAPPVSREEDTKRRLADVIQEIIQQKLNGHGR
jgi:Dehydratase medium subunit.